MPELEDVEVVAGCLVEVVVVEMKVELDAVAGAYTVEGAPPDAEAVEA